MDETKPAPMGYTLTPLYPIQTGFIATQAFIMCCSCGTAIASSGGPRYNVICLKCADHLGTLGSLK
jgi:ribosomal protein S27E